MAKLMVLAAAENGSASRCGPRQTPCGILGARSTSPKCDIASSDEVVPNNDQAIQSEDPIEKKIEKHNINLCSSYQDQVPRSMLFPLSRSQCMVATWF